jgi:hypothetical protein
MWPDDRSVIHVIEAAQGLTGSPLECQFLKVLHEEVGDNWTQWGTYSQEVSLFVELATENLLTTCFHAHFLLCLFFNPADGSNMFLQNVSCLSTDYTMLYPRRQSPSNPQ